MLMPRVFVAACTLVTSGPGLLPRTTSWPMVLPQLGSILMSMAPVITKGRMDAWGLGPNLWSCGCQGEGTCHHWGHTDLSGLHCSQGRVVIWTGAPTMDNVWVHDFRATRI